MQLSVLMTDPDLCEPFTIRRRRGEWGVGGYSPVSEDDINVLGVASATNSDDLELVPEGDRTTGMMTFYCREPLHVAETDQPADEILWSGNVYKVVAVADWKRHGFCEAITRKTGPDGSGL
jgi:hypothetical protein